jgi:hypothetical protein
MTYDIAAAQDDARDATVRAQAALGEAQAALEEVHEALAELDGLRDRPRPTPPPLDLKLAELAVTSALSFVESLGESFR